MYHIPIYKVQLIRDGSQPAYNKIIHRPVEVYEFLKDFLGGLDRENFVAVFLDSKNKVIGINTIAVGTLSYAPVHPREVFKAAILCNAVGVILAHNHPSGDPSPSSADLSVTKQLKEAGEIIGIDIIDHVVIGDGIGRYESLKEMGVI
jgi:DNA repair protein RadC